MIEAIISSVGFRGELQEISEKGGQQNETKEDWHR